MLFEDYWGTTTVYCDISLLYLKIFKLFIFADLTEVSLTKDDTDTTNF